VASGRASAAAGRRARRPDDAGADRDHAGVESREDRWRAPLVHISQRGDKRDLQIARIFNRNSCRVRATRGMAGLHSEMIDTGREYFRNLPSELIRRHGDLVVAKPSPAMYPIVALTAAVGARRNEVLALRWTDLDVENKTLRIERAWEPTKKFGLRLKPPKTARGCARSRWMMVRSLCCSRSARGTSGSAPAFLTVPTSTFRCAAARRRVDLPGCLRSGRKFLIRDASQSPEFQQGVCTSGQAARLADFKFHHLRGTHSTLLLDRGVPVHTVADRIGDDPAVLLRNYAKRKRTNTVDNSVSAVISALAAGFLGS
jgi:integrase